MACRDAGEGGLPWSLLACWSWRRDLGRPDLTPRAVLCGSFRARGLGVGGAVCGQQPASVPSSQLDVLTHRFITLLADTSDSRAAESRVADANMACRKLAVAHPLLLLR